MDERDSAVGRYRVQAVIGSGGFGTVYFGTDPDTGRPVAVKVLDRAGADAAQRSRLRAEAAAMRRIDDPHCVRVLDVIDEPRVAAIVTEFVDGASLRAVLERAGRLTGPQSLDILRGALRGLVAVHAAGLVHGDIKPDNVLVDRTGTSRLIDFGLAASPSTATAADGVLVGSPSYLSPEQIRGEPADVRSDIYAVAIMLFELLCGRRPFVANSQIAVLAMHVQAPVPDPRGVVPDIGTGLAQLCRAGLAKDPAQRPQTARAFLTALEDAARERYGAAWATGLGLGALVGGAVGLGAEHAVAPAPSAVPAHPPRAHHRPAVGRAARPARRLLIRFAVGGGAVAVAATAVVVVTLTSRHHSAPQAAPPAPRPAPTTPSVVSSSATTTVPPPAAPITGRLLVTGPAGPAATRTFQDELIDPTGHVLTRYPAASAVCCYGRSLSPDGSQVLALGEGMLQVGPVTGTARTIWSTPNAIISTAAWSPNGQLIAFALTDDSTRVPTSQLDVIGVQDAQPSVVAKGTNIHSIAWSPDGHRIAFLQNQGGISLATLGGGAVTRLRTPPTMLPTTIDWAPGAQLIFAETGTAPAGTWTVGTDGSAPRLLLAGATSPSWAPGGRYFAAIRAGHVVIAARAGHVVRTIGPARTQRVQWGGSG